VTALPEDVRERPETVGRPLQFTAVTIVDDDGEALPAGERGEVVVAGPTVTPGYLDEDTTADSVGEQGLHTRDLGYRDPDGFLHVLGRLDDTIVTGGETVHPAAVADALRDHPEVRDAAVVGLPDEEWGERIAALVEAVDYPIGDLQEFARGALPDYAVPKAVVFAETLPRTDSGTVDREAVRDRVREA
jgi:O-succinylbenzoic acid--CoA ligase